MITRSKDLDFFSTLIKLQNLGAVFMIVSFVSLQTLCKGKLQVPRHLLLKVAEQADAQINNSIYLIYLEHWQNRNNI